MPVLTACTGTNVASRMVHPTTHGRRLAPIIFSLVWLKKLVGNRAFLDSTSRDGLDVTYTYIIQYKNEISWEWKFQNFLPCSVSDFTPRKSINIRININIAAKAIWDQSSSGEGVWWGGMHNYHNITCIHVCNYNCTKIITGWRTPAPWRSIRWVFCCWAHKREIEFSTHWTLWYMHILLFVMIMKH